MTTEPNDASLPQARKYGARVFQLNGGVVIVYQTVKSGPNHNDPYKIDGDKNRHVDPGDDALLGQVVRKALAGEL